MLIAENLSKKYGNKVALSNLNLNISSGEVFALLGQNGAGTTTGSTQINGLRVQDNPVLSKKYLAYVPETVMLYPTLSGIENLSFFAALGGFSYTKNELRAFLFKAGLQNDAHEQRLEGYSKGMRQKVGIAIALAKKAKALLLDEPTSGLDPKASNEFSEIIAELSKTGVAVLMATHDIFRAKEIAHRIGIMKEGNLVSVIDANAISANELEKLYLQTV